MENTINGNMPKFIIVVSDSILSFANHKNLEIKAEKDKNPNSLITVMRGANVHKQYCVFFRDRNHIFEYIEDEPARMYIIE